MPFKHKINIQKYVKIKSKNNTFIKKARIKEKNLTMLRKHYKNKYLQFIILVFFTLCLQFIYRSHSMVSRQVKQLKKNLLRN